MAQVRVIDLEADYRFVDKLTACVDLLRESTDDELRAPTSNIRVQRLVEEMERLTSMTHKVTDLERELLRGISKSDRIVQEVGQFRQEIKVACE
ncbi:MAG: hypothetical protein OXC69_08580 [Candidatus Tectomicrobia bacterium]|nr:hypothetical protein [Candidatus Tectomicrobia bacterium]